MQTVIKTYNNMEHLTEQCDKQSLSLPYSCLVFVETCLFQSI